MNLQEMLLTLGKTRISKTKYVERKPLNGLGAMIDRTVNIEVDGNEVLSIKLRNKEYHVKTQYDKQIYFQREAKYDV